MTRQKLQRATLALAVMTALGLPAAPAFAQAKPPIKVGAILPMTGFGATYGELFHTAVVMAVEEINAKGGVNGSQIQLVVTDDQLAAPQSVLLFRRLVSDNVFAVVGPVSGTSWENVAPIANQMKTPALNFSAIKPGITIKPYALRTAMASDTLAGDGVTEFAKKFPAAKRIVITGDVQEASGQAGMEEWKKAAAKAGLQVVGVVEYQTKTTDFAPVVSKIRSFNADAVFTCSLVPTSLPLVKELETQRFDKPVLDCGLISAGNFIHAMGGSAKNIYSVNIGTNEADPNNPRRETFINNFLKRSAETTKLPQPANVSNTSLPYDTTMLLADIMRRKGIDGNTPVEKARDLIKDGLAETRTYSGVNQIRMRDTGDGHVVGHLMQADPQAKVWRYVLPADQRNKQP
jgi:branched-chain amino acid transport system substrate-binding protein